MKKIRSVYIAASFVARDRAKEIREYLRSVGVGCTAAWIDTHLPDEDISDSVAMTEAATDLSDIRRADALILLREPRSPASTTGGMHFEAGYAYAQGIPIIVVGPKSSVFYRLPGIQCVDRIEQAVGLLEKVGS